MPHVLESEVQPYSKGDRMTTALLIIGGILLVAYGPLGMIKGAGYLVQKYKFGIPFKELYAQHKEQDNKENN
jgi:hypothetical protein